MIIKRIAIILFLIIVITPAGLTAQTGDSDSSQAGVGSDSEGFVLSIDLRTGINVLGFVPGIPVLIGVPMSISADSVSIAPQFGFLYYFDILTDLHNPYYIPLGINLIYNPMDLGIDILYYHPVGGPNTNQLLSALVVSEFNILKKGRFSFLLELKFGPSFVFNPEGINVFAMVNCALIPRFKL